MGTHYERHTSKCLFIFLVWAFSLAVWPVPATAQQGDVFHKTTVVPTMGMVYCGQYYKLSYQLWCTLPVTTWMTLASNCPTATNSTANVTSCPVMPMQPAASTCTQTQTCSVSWPSSTDLIYPFCLAINPVSNVYPLTICMITLTSIVPDNYTSTNHDATKWATWQIIVTAVVAGVGLIAMFILFTFMFILCCPSWIAHCCGCCRCCSSKPAVDVKVTPNTAELPPPLDPYWPGPTYTLPPSPSYQRSGIGRFDGQHLPSHLIYMSPGTLPPRPSQLPPLTSPPVPPPINGIGGSPGGGPAPLPPPLSATSQHPYPLQLSPGAQSQPGGAPVGTPTPMSGGGAVVDTGGHTKTARALQF